MGCADGGIAVGEAEEVADVLGEVVGLGTELAEDAVREGAEEAGGQFAGGLVDRDDAAGVERRPRRPLRLR